MTAVDVAEVSSVYSNVTTETPYTTVRDGPLFDAASSKMFEIYIYPFVLTLIYMFVGLFGNSIVIYVFTFQWKLTKPTIFILTLAWVDLFSCAFNMPVEAAMLWRPMNFDVDVLCKVSRFTTFVTSAGSSFVLCAIAIDRYIMVCRPFQSRTMGIPYAKKTCVIAVLLGVFSSWPSLIFYGTHTYYVNVTEFGHTFHIEGKNCLISNDYIEHNTVPVAFYIFLFGGHVIMFLILMTMYVLIGRRLYISANSDVSEQRRHSAKFLGLSLVSAMTGVIPHDAKSLGSRSCSRAVSMDNIRIERNPNPFFPEGISITPRQSVQRINSLNGDVCVVNNPDRRNTEPGAILVSPTDNATAGQDDGNYQCSSTNNAVQRDIQKSSEQDKGDCDERETYQLDLPARECHNGGYRCSECRAATDRIASVPGSNQAVTPITPNSTRPIISRSQSVESKYKINRILEDELKILEVKEFSLKRNTLIMRVVTIAFIVSFLPYLIIATIRHSHPDTIPDKLNKGTQIAYHVLLRMYFINSMINPLIYGFMNEEFRLKLKELCCRMCKKPTQRSEY